MAWTDEKRQQAIELYTAENPTEETSTEILKQVAEELDETPNGVRMVLSKANVYVKSTGAKPAAKTAGTADSDKPKRVSKADSIAELTQVIESTGMSADSDILDKLTGKQAVYFTTILRKLV